MELEAKEAGSDSVCIYLSQDMLLWPVALHIFMKLQFLQRMLNFLVGCLTVSFSKDYFTWKYIQYSIAIDRLSF